VTWSAVRLFRRFNDRTKPTSQSSTGSFFSSLKTERVGRKTYRTRDEARADVFDYIVLAALSQTLPERLIEQTTP
jgi:hypothetical protein